MLLSPFIWLRTARHSDQVAERKPRPATGSPFLCSPLLSVCGSFSLLLLPLPPLALLSLPLLSLRLWTLLH